MARSIALLRAVNVGDRKMPMAELRTLCVELGWTEIETYIQSGNLLFAAPGQTAEQEASLEKAVEQRFGYRSDVIIRSAEQWRGLLAANPFVSEAEAEPNRVLVGLAKARLQPGAANSIQAKATAGERVEQAGEALWFHYPEGAGTSKLTPSSIDRSAGSPVTARNWRTMLKLGEMVGAPPP